MRHLTTVVCAVASVLIFTSAASAQAIPQGGSLFNPPLPASFEGTCTTCHNTPNAGNHSIVAPLDIGLSEASRRTPDLPLYTFRQKCGAPSCPTRAVTDPGRALISGKFADIGKFKGPVLRGLAARAPYFQDGKARDIKEVVDFYHHRFDLGLSGDQRDDLVAFLSAL